MSVIRAARSRVRSQFRGAALDREMDEELTSQIEMATDDLEQQGLSREEARRIALVRFGGIDPARQLQRESRGLPALENLAPDLRRAVRTLRRSPGESPCDVPITVVL
jgi:hypothetical protein